MDKLFNWFKEKKFTVTDVTTSFENKNPISPEENNIYYFKRTDKTEWYFKNVSHNQEIKYCFLFANEGYIMARINDNTIDNILRIINNILDNDEFLLTCPICCEEGLLIICYDCTYNLCRKCLNKLYQQNPHIKCPHCRNDFKYSLNIL
jgi:hypothetical protein